MLRVRERDLISPLNLGIGPEKRGKDSGPDWSKCIGTGGGIGGMACGRTLWNGSPTQNATKVKGT